jgi:hypothetical protein
MYFEDRPMVLHQAPAISSYALEFRQIYSANDQPLVSDRYDKVVIDLSRIPTDWSAHPVGAGVGNRATCVFGIDTSTQPSLIGQCFIGASNKIISSCSMARRARQEARLAALRAECGP